MIHSFTIVNKQGKLRIYKDYLKDSSDTSDRKEDMIRHCLMNAADHNGILEYENCMVIYRRYTSLYFIAVTTQDENELAISEFIQNFAEILQSYFEKVTEMDILFNMDKIYMILDEMIVNGYIIETNKSRILVPLQLLDTSSK